MNKALVVFSVCGVACFCIGEAGAAGSIYTGAELLGFHSETEVSGAPQSATVQIPDNNYINAAREPSALAYGDRRIELRRLDFFERSDEPCAVSLLTATRVEGDEHTWDGCGGRPRSRQSVLKSFITYQDPDHSQNVYRHAFLTGIRVCHSTRPDERSNIVKGVEAQWTSVPNRENTFWDNPSSPWFVQNGGDDFARPNCNDNWQEWVRCPDETVAAALVLHHKALGGRRALTGVSLRCYSTVSKVRDLETWEVLTFRPLPSTYSQPQDPLRRLDSGPSKRRKKVQP